jgi:hypothetical protein
MFPPVELRRRIEPTIVLPDIRECSLKKAREFPASWLCGSE